MSIPFYLAHRLFYRIKAFIIHWYGDSFLFIGRKTTNILESLDRFFALKITFRNFLRPLYQDYTFLGYLLGFFFRFWRILFSAVIYSAVIAVSFLIYVIWAAIPVYIVYRGL